MNDHNPYNPHNHNHNEPRQDEPTAVEIINVKKSYYIGKMEVPILHGIDLAIHTASISQSGAASSLRSWDHPARARARL